MWALREAGVEAPRHSGGFVGETMAVGIVKIVVLVAASRDGRERSLWLREREFVLRDLSVATTLAFKFDS